MASLGIRTMNELIGRTDLLVADDAVDHWKARGIDLSQLLAFPELPEGAPRHRIELPPGVARRPPGLGASSRQAKPRDRRRAGRSRSSARSRTSTAASAASSPTTSPRSTGSRGWRRTASRVDLLRHRRAVVRRLAGQRRDVHAARRRQRLHRQGPVGRHARPSARRDGATYALGGQRRDRQHRALRRDRRQGVLPRPGRRALLRAQLGRQRGRRGRRRPRLRVHDRRARRRARADRPQLRRGHERRPGVRPRRGRHVRASASTRRWSTSSRRSSESDAIEVHALVTEHRERTGSPVAAACSTSGRRCGRSSSRSSRPTTSACWPSSPRRRTPQTYAVSDEEGETADIVGVPDTRVADEGE